MVNKFNPQRQFAHNGPTLEEIQKYNHFDQVVDAFSKRIRDWYLDQARNLKSGGEGFVIVCLCCVVLDMLSQYEFNLEKSEGDEFMKFLRRRSPAFQPNLPKSIDWILSDGKTPMHVENYAKAFWLGFRNAIVHNGMVMGFGRVSGGQGKVIDQPNANNGDLDVVVDPILLLRETENIFGWYITELKDRSNKLADPLRENFSKKFERDFGISIQRLLQS